MNLHRKELESLVEDARQIIAVSKSIAGMERKIRALPLLRRMTKVERERAVYDLVYTTKYETQFAPPDMTLEEARRIIDAE